ncbi:MAG: AhpC/TSA family protein [Rhodospirillales bacterium]|nr:AhpC/TSA family protein [Rhodospirillales bacterium]
MSLQAELSSIENTLPSDLAASIGTMVNRIVNANSGAGTRAQKVGDDAPSFILSDARGNATALRALLMQGPVVLVFYRGRWCPYCSAELAAYQLALPDIKACKTSLVAISPEAPDGSLTEDEIDALSLEILSDPGNQTARTFGLVYRLDDESRPLYERNGLDLGKINDDES